MKRYVWLLFLLIIGVLGFAPIVPRYGAPFVGGGCQDAIGSLSMYTWFMDSEAGKKIGIDDTSHFCVDRQKLYFDKAEMVGADIATFAILPKFGVFSVDGRNIYFQNTSIFTPSANDPIGNVVEITTGCISNTTHIWCGKTMLPDGADAQSFEVLNDVYFKDKNHIYYRNEILKDADVSTFQILSGQGELAEDINSSYKYGLRIPKNIETTGQAQTSITGAKKVWTGDISL